ncbi:LOW QUALITY PROTEIN: uncharacterized protein ACR2FA_004377 [Aphomia sociella]
MESILHSLDNMTEHFNSRMAAFQEEFQRAGTGPATGSLSSLTSDFTTFKMFITGSLNELQKQIQLIAQQQDQLEMRSRRKILLVHGKLVSERLKLPNFSIDCIGRSHRMGRVGNSGGKPRPILVKFREMAVRDKVWYAKTALKNSDITLSEFLTKGRHDAFLAARKYYGVTKCWTRSVSIVIDGSDGKKYRVNSVSEVNRLISEMPVTVTSTTSSASLKTMDTAGATRAKRALKK